MGNGILQIVILLDHKAVFGHERVRLRRDGIATLVLTVHPNIDRRSVLADTKLVCELITSTIAHQAPIEALSQKRPFLCLFGIDSREVNLLTQRDVVGLLIVCLLPGCVSATLHFGQLVLRTVDPYRARTFDIVLWVIVHLGNSGLPIAFINLDEHSLHGSRTLIGNELIRFARGSKLKGIGHLSADARNGT